MGLLRYPGAGSPLCHAFLLAAVWLALALPAAAQRATFDEREVKAVFLFNFVQFVDWPSIAFASPDAPVVIGVLGDDPFGRLLDDVVEGEVVKGRRLSVVRFRRVEDIKACHVLFISASETAMYEHILTVLRDKPTLTVGETASFATRGMIRFLTDRNRVRLEVNVGAARASGLIISSNLLRLARIVGTARS